MKNWSHDKLHELIDANPKLKTRSDIVHSLPQTSGVEREKGKLSMMELYAEAVGCKRVVQAKKFVDKVFERMRNGGNIGEISTDYIADKICHSPLGNDYTCFCDEN